MSLRSPWAALLWAALLVFCEEPKKEAKPPAAPSRAGLSRAAAVRNENVPVNRIDNEALKEVNIRLGDNVTLVAAPLVEANYFATEHGRPAGEQSVLPAAAPPGDWHGELYEYHRNSAFNARTFFQVGGVLPSRQNHYGGRLTGHGLTGGFWQRKTRGMVNGNVLVPLAGERTPLATDGAARRVVARFLAAYPDVAPNRPDFDPRALNTNAPQRIDEIDGSLRLDRDFAKGRLSASHALGRQRILAFQFVAGQNPDTEIHTHRARLTWRRAFSGRTDLAVGAGFTRGASLLVPEPNAVGPRVRIGYQIEELGPDSHFPIDRAMNTFRYGAVASHRRGAHAFTFGGDVTRYQLNGIETNNNRGVIWFTNNFGRTAIENLRWGTPTTYEVTVGEMARGFRHWGANFFFADRWKATSRLEVYWGLRYNLESAPVEVNGLNDAGYGCDCNNLSPRLALAWRPAGEWVLRASFTVSFGQIFPVTYQQVRYNLPRARYLQVQNPDLLDPLRGIDLRDPGGRSSPTFLSPDLVAPYSHQYNASFENRLAGRYLLRAGYIGSRTFKLLDSHQTNRGEVIPGIPLTTQTVDLRRRDPRYYDVKWVLNGGAAYMDGGQVTVEAPYRRGLLWGATYTFGKALDTGSDYAGTAANRDLSKQRSQSQYEIFRDKKGLSSFDSTHALLLYYSYDLPRGAGGWQLSGSWLAKTGTPFSLFIGSDAPGYGNVDGGPSDRPNLLDPSILGMTVGHPDEAPGIIRRERFAFIPVGETRGSLARNAFRKGGIANFNAAVSRSWRLGGQGERLMIFRAEAFNLTNHPQFDEPQRNLSSPSFGRITNTLNDGRVIQLGLRFLM